MSVVRLLAKTFGRDVASYILQFVYQFDHNHFDAHWDVTTRVKELTGCTKLYTHCDDAFYIYKRGEGWSVTLFRETKRLYGLDPYDKYSMNIHNNNRKIKVKLLEDKMNSHVTEFKEFIQAVGM